MSKNSSYETDKQKFDRMMSQIYDLSLEKEFALILSEASNKLIHVFEDQNSDSEFSNLKLELSRILLCQNSIDYRLQDFKQTFCSVKLCDLDDDGNLSYIRLKAIKVLAIIEEFYAYIMRTLVMIAEKLEMPLRDDAGRYAQYLGDLVMEQEFSKQNNVYDAILIFITDSLEQCLNDIDNQSIDEENKRKIESFFDLLFRAPDSLSSKLSNEFFELLWRFFAIENVEVLRLALHVTGTLAAKNNNPDLVGDYFKRVQSLYQNSKNPDARDRAMVAMVNITKRIPTIVQSVFIQLKEEINACSSPWIRVSCLSDLLELDHSLATEIFTLTSHYLDDSNLELVSKTMPVISTCIRLKPDLGSLNLTNKALALLSCTDKVIKIRSLRLLENLILFYLEEMFQKERAIYSVAEFINYPDEHIRDEAIFVMTCTAKKHPKLFPLVITKFASNLAKNINWNSNIPTMMKALECDLVDAKIENPEEILKTLNTMLDPVKRLAEDIQNIILKVDRPQASKS